MNTLVWRSMYVDWEWRLGRRPVHPHAGGGESEARAGNLQKEGSVASEVHVPPGMDTRGVSIQPKVAREQERERGNGNGTERDLPTPPTRNLDSPQTFTRKGVLLSSVVTFSFFHSLLFPSFSNHQNCRENRPVNSVAILNTSPASFFPISFVLSM